MNKDQYRYPITVIKDEKTKLYQILLLGRVQDVDADLSEQTMRERILSTPVDFNNRVVHLIFVYSANCRSTTVGQLREIQGDWYEGHTP